MKVHVIITLMLGVGIWLEDDYPCVALPFLVVKFSGKERL